MRQPLLFALLVALVVTSCAQGKKELLPPLVPAPDTAGALQGCRTLFPPGRWQFVHTIAFHMANGTNGTVLGVLVLQGREIQCALMTVEGLTLFEARAAGAEEPEVLRALPPFDNRAFAAGLMRDVRTLFQPPPGVARAGTLAEGTPVCRFTAENTVTDIRPQEDGCWQMDIYDQPTDEPGDSRPAPRKTRTIHARSCSPAGAATLPHALELTAFGPTGYTLNLRLISAEPLPASL